MLDEYTNDELALRKIAEKRKRKRCFQCGRPITDKKKNFCDAICRAAYNTETWGEGRPTDPNTVPLTKRLKQSLKRQEHMAKKKKKNKKKDGQDEFTYSVLLAVEVSSSQTSAGNGVTLRDVKKELKEIFDDLTTVVADDLGCKVKVKQLLTMGE
jgi:hypothetical protein